MIKPSSNVTINECNIFFNYIFDCGCLLDPIRTFKMLAESDFVQFFANNRNNSIEFAKMYSNPNDAIQNERHRMDSFAKNVFYENEKYVFSEQYLSEGAIVKGFLQPFSIIDSNNTKHTLDVFLVLHRSGTAILTIAIPLAGNFTSLDINEMMKVSSLLPHPHLPHCPNITSPIGT